MSILSRRLRSFIAHCSVLRAKHRHLSMQLKVRSIAFVPGSRSDCNIGKMNCGDVGVHWRKLKLPSEHVKLWLWLQWLPVVDVLPLTVVPCKLPSYGQSSVCRRPNRNCAL